MTAKRETRNVLAEFFREEYHSIKAYVRSMINDTADSPVEDIVQDVALRLFSRSEDAVPIENVGAFVYGSVRNRVIDVLRSRKRGLTETENDNLEDPEAEEDLIAAMGENFSESLADAVRHAVMGLKKPYREIILAVDYEGLSYREVSERTGTPAGTLMSRRHRAISLLYKQLKTSKALSF